MDLFKEKYILQTEHGPSQKVRVALGETNSMDRVWAIAVGELFQLFWGIGWRFLGTEPPLTFWSLRVSLGPVLAPLVVSFSLLMCCSECILRIKV